MGILKLKKEKMSEVVMNEILFQLGLMMTMLTKGNSYVLESGGCGKGSDRCPCFSAGCYGWIGRIRRRQFSEVESSGTEKLKAIFNMGNDSFLSSAESAREESLMEILLSLLLNVVKLIKFLQRKKIFFPLR